MKQQIDPTMDTTTGPSVERRGMNRRGFLALGGALSAAAVLAACGSDGDAKPDSNTPLGSETTTSGAESTTTAASGGMSADKDLELGAFAASLEVLAVNTYGAALDAAKKGSLGDVPPAVAEFMTTAKDQHQAHLDKWNEVLTGADQDEVTEPPKDLERSVDDEFGKVKDVAGAAKLARDLEMTAAATYLAVIPMLSTEDAIGLVASIQPIDMQHVAILNFALGEYPVPDTFANTQMAATP